MTGADWEDPFAEDEAARERARRRAEREARRRAAQASLGEKAGQAPAAPPPPTPPPERPVERTPERPPVDPPSSEHVAVPAAEPPTPPPHPEASPDPGFEWTDLRERVSRPMRRGSVPPGQLWLRRALGLGVLVAFIVVAAIVVSKVLDVLDGSEAPVQGPATLEVDEVVIPEGLDRRQIAAQVKKTVKGNYMKATKKAPKGFPIKKYAPDGAPSLEGFLFPATYELEKGASAKDLVERQLAAFEDNISSVDMSYAKSKNLTVYDVLKIASIIEREIAVPKERRLAAAVIYNRLAAGDTLGMDATIRYYLQNYDKQLTESQLADPHPFNTRVNPGLPPTPIGNPGLASIKAAAKPAKSNAYYFVIKPGTCNEHTFVETAEEFAEAEAEYQRALQEEGGSPTEC